MPIPVLTLREALSYDRETGLFTWKVRPIYHFKNDAKWSAKANQDRWNTLYAAKSALSQPTGKGYVGGSVDNIKVSAHRAAFAWVTGDWPKVSVDHINGVRDDNRISNLREASRSQQNRNCSPHHNGTSKYLGVSWRADRKHWRSVIFIDGKQKSLGRFDDEVLAAKAYDKAAAENYGEFARLNFPF